MGGGDLNMKKSWHPLLIKNQERVWKEEQKALEEQKKLTQLKKEKEEERQLQELRKLQEVAGGKKGPERLDWMYAAGPNQSVSAKAQELEDFLLGKKRVDSLVDKGTSLSKLSANSNDVFIDATNPNANSYRDTQTKIREDPLLAIKKTEQANIKAIVTNPLKLKKLKEKKKDKKSKKDQKESKKHELYEEPKNGNKSHHKATSGDDSFNINREISKHDRSKRSRSRSLSRSRSRERYYDKRYSESLRLDGSDNSRKYDYAYKKRNGDSRYDSSETFERRRSFSPPRKRNRRSSPSHCRENSSNQSRNHQDGHRNSNENVNTFNKETRRKLQGNQSRNHQDGHRNSNENGNTFNKEAQRKLQEMMDNAKRLAEERKKRVERINREEKEEENQLAEEKKRTLERGIHSEYLKKAYKDAYSSSSSFDLGERVRRHRGTTQKTFGE